MWWTVYYTFLITGCMVTGLKDVHVTVPRAVRHGDSVILHCHYDLEGEPLYAVKWYKGRNEFYRYTSKEIPYMILFPIPDLSDLNVDKRKSNESQLFLQAVTTAMTGLYSCEVTTDAPFYNSAVVTKKIDVVEFSLDPPTLTGIKERYRVHEVMKANCTAAPSIPAVNLTWDINGENVNPKLVKQYRQVPEKYSDLQQSTSILEVSLRAHHFTPEGRLKVGCTASLYDLYWQTTAQSAEEEGRRGSASGNKEKDLWYDYDYDTEDNIIIGAFPNISSNEEVDASSHSCPTTHVVLYKAFVSTSLLFILNSL